MMMIKLTMKNSLIKDHICTCEQLQNSTPFHQRRIARGLRCVYTCYCSFMCFLLLIGFRCLVLRVLTSSRYGSLPVLASKTLTKKVSVLVLVVFDLTQVLMLVKANLCYKRYSSFFHVPHVLSPTCSIVWGSTITPLGHSDMPKTSWKHEIESLPQKN